MTHAFISLKTQFENLGDALINRELIKIVSARVPTTVDLTRSPASFHSTMELERISNINLLTKFRGVFFFQMMKKALSGETCYFFLNPGGLGGGVGNSVGAFCKSHLYNCALLLLKVIGVRICHVGISYEKMKWKEASVAKLRSWACFNFSVRDGESFDYIRTLGVKTNEIVPDLSFNLYCEPLNTDTCKRYAGAFSFRTDKGNSPDDLKSFARRVIYGAAGDTRFLFVSQVRRDSRIMQELQQQLGAEFGPQRLHFADCHADFNRAVSLYRECDTLYSNRLHALLLAAYAHAKPVAVINLQRQRKIAALFEDLGLSNNVCELSAVSMNAKEANLDRFVQESKNLNDFFNRLLND